jgi:hypothetical protein
MKRARSEPFARVETPTLEASTTGVHDRQVHEWDSRTRSSLQGSGLRVETAASVVGQIQLMLVELVD